MSIEASPIPQQNSPDAVRLLKDNPGVDKAGSKERFGQILTALGSEPKCIVLLCLKKGPLSAHYLHKEFQSVTDEAWQMNPRNQANYCELTLIPQGLVDKDSGNQYFLTEDGSKYGVPAAAFLIVESSKLPFSLMSLLGATNTAGDVSSAVNRAAILKSLNSKSGIVREIDLEQETGINRKVVGPHLEALAKIGVVSYQAVDFEQSGDFKYRIAEGAKRENVRKVGTRPTLTQQVADIVFEKGLVDSASIFSLLIGAYPNTNRLRERIGQILTGLELQGICTRAPFKSGEQHSSVEITPLGRQIVDEMIIPLEQATSGDEELLSSWLQLPWQAHASQVIEKYAAESGYAHGIGFSDRVATVQGLIQQKPGIRPREIQAQIGGRRPYDLINWLLARGKIRREEDGKKTRYYSLE